MYGLSNISYKIGVVMRSGIVATGTVLLAIGLILVIFLWPMIAYETKDTFNLDDVEPKEKIRYVGEITEISEYGDIFVLELDDGALFVFTKNENLKQNERILVTVEFGENTSDWSDNSYHVEKLPTQEGVVGVIIFIFGLIIMIVGIFTSKISIADIVKFNVQPPAQTQMHQETQISDLQSVNLPQPLTLQPRSSTIQTPQIQQTSCPKCGKKFGVQIKTRPQKITCPNCGVEGIIE